MADFDFRVIPSNPVIDAVDRRGQQYMLGLGNAAPTDFAAGVQGLEHGLAFGANLAAKIQETNRLNDPETLAAEQLRRELQNKQLEEAITTAQISNRYEPAKIETDIAYKGALTTGQGLSNQITAAYGMEEAAAKIAQSRAAAASSYATAANAPLAALQKNAAFLKSVTPTGKDAQQDVIAPSFGGSNSILPEPNISPSQGFTSDLDAAKQQLFQDYQKMTSNGVQGQILSQRDAIGNQIVGQNLANKQAQNNITKRSVAENNYMEAIAAINDTDWEGSLNLGALAKPVGVLSEVHSEETNPADKASYAAQLADIVRTVGPKKLQDTIDAMPDEQQKIAATELFSKAIIATGDAALWTPDQKAIVGAGLSPEHAADPTETYNKVDQLITSGTTNIDDPNFNSTMATSRYVIAATAASKNGAQSYSIRGGSVPLQGGTSDLAGGDQTSAIGLVFTGQDGTIAYAPDPGQDPRLQSQFNLVNKVASRQQVSIPAQNAINQNISNIQNLQGENQQVTQTDTTGRPNFPTESERAAQEERNPPVLGVTDESQIPTGRLETINKITGGNRSKDAVTAASTTLRDYESSVAPLIEKSVKAEQEIEDIQQQSSTIDQIIDLAISTDNADYVGKNSKLDQTTNKLLSLVGKGDPIRNELQDLFAISKLQSILRVISGRTTAFNSAAEQQSVREGTVSLSSEFATIENVAAGLKAEMEQNREANNISTLSRGVMKNSDFIQRKTQEYLASTVSKPLILNPNRSDSNQPDFIRNPKFETAQQFLGLAPKPKPPSSSIGTGASGNFGPSSPNTNTPDIATNPTAQGADIVGSSSSSSSSGGFPSANTPFTTSSASSAGGPAVSATPEGQQLSQIVATEQTPPTESIQQKLDRRDPQTLQQYQGLVNNYQNLTGVEGVDAAINGLDYLADSILFNKGKSVQYVANRLQGLSPEDAEVYTQAAQTAREEFAKRNQWTALGLDAFATAVDFVIGGAAIRGAASVGGALTGLAAEGIAQGSQLGARAVSGLRQVGETVSRAASTFGAGARNVDIAGQAGIDALILTAREENPDMGDLLFNFAASGIIQKGLVPLGELGSKGWNKLVQRYEQGGPNVRDDLVNLAREEGIAKEAVEEALTKARELSPEGEVSAVGTIAPEGRETLSGALRTPESRAQVLSTAGERAAREEAALTSNVRSLNLENVRTADDLTKTVQDSIKSQIDDQVAQASNTATAQKNEAAGNIVKELVEGKVKPTQEGLNIMYGAVGEPAPNVRSSIGGAAQGEAELVVPRKLEDAKIISEMIETTTGPNSVFRQFTEKTFDKLDTKITQNLENKLINLNPNEAPRAIEQVRLKRGLTGDGIENTIGFYDDLRQAIGENIGGTGSPTFEAMKEAVVKAGDQALEKMGVGKGYYTGFIKGYGNLKEFGKLVDQDIIKLEVLNDALKGTTPSKIQQSLISKGASKETIDQAGSFDIAIETLNNLSKGRKIADISEFAKELVQAQKLIGDTDSTFFAKQLMSKGEGMINRLKRALPSEERDLLEQGVLRTIKDNIDRTGNIGLSEGELANAKKILTPEQVKLLDIFDKRKEAILETSKFFENNSLQTVNQQTASGPIKRAGMLALRLLAPTARTSSGAAVGFGVGGLPGAVVGGAIGVYFDLMAKLGSKGISNAAKLRITEALTKPPKDVNALFEEVAKILPTTREITSGQKTGRVSKENLDRAKVLFLSLWGAEESVEEKQDAVTNREAKARRANRK